MESTGSINKIHLSKETAELLIGAGKAHWVMSREDLVEAKGKGRLQTFWLKPKVGSDTNKNSTTVSENSEDPRSETGSSICDDRDLTNDLETIEEIKEYQSAASTEKKRRSARVSEVAFGENGVRQRSDRLVDWNVEV
jgi:hypothetical protein